MWKKERPLVNVCNGTIASDDMRKKERPLVNVCDGTIALSPCAKTVPSDASCCIVDAMRVVKMIPTPT